MKFLLPAIFLVTLFSCNPSKKIKTGATDTGVDTDFIPNEEMATKANELLHHQNEIPFNTFSAKVKVEYEDMYGKQPETNAFIRMKKDEFIWVSVTATFLNVEAARIWITPDSIIIVNKLEKTIQARPIHFIRDYVSLPFSFQDIQNLIAGKVIFAGDSIQTVASTDKFLLVSTLLPNAENNIYFTLPSLLLARQNLFISGPAENYQAEILYNDYEKPGGNYFSTSRMISIPAKQQKIRLDFRQYEFNKELSVPFNRPEGYTIN